MLGNLLFSAAFTDQVIAENLNGINSFVPRLSSRSSIGCNL